LAWYPT